MSTCAHCGKEIKAGNKFCNVTCSNKARKILKDKECRHCGKTFSPRSSTSEFCSNSCSSRHTSQKGVKFLRKYKHTCQHCNKEFMGTRKNQKFCSRKCGREFNRPVYNLVCEQCDQPFQTQHQNQRFCSRQCNSESISIAPKIKTCEICGKDFERKHPRQVYCSVTCRQTPNPDKKTTSICKGCGKEFEHWTYRDSVFCSRRCMSSYAAKLPKPSRRRPENFITKICEWCKEEYTIHKIYVDSENGRNSRFCSIECRGKDKSQSMKGENNPNYIHGEGYLYPSRGSNWGAQRRKALKRDNHECRICKAKVSKGGKSLDVHHIRPYRLFENDWKKANRLNNLVTLCRQCHIDVENGKAKIPKLKTSP